MIIKSDPHQTDLWKNISEKRSVVYFIKYTCARYQVSFIKYWLPMGQIIMFTIFYYLMSKQGSDARDLRELKCMLLYDTAR